MKTKASASTTTTKQTAAAIVFSNQTGYQNYTKGVDTGVDIIDSNGIKLT